MTDAERIAALEADLLMLASYVWQHSHSHAQDTARFTADGRDVANICRRLKGLDLLPRHPRPWEDFVPLSADDVLRRQAEK